MTTEWTTHDVVVETGVTSRTLRHYDAIGLLKPTRDGATRLYGRAAMLRLQSILVLRELGIPLDQIGELLDGESDPAAALARHEKSLTRKVAQLKEQISAVRATRDALKKGHTLMPDFSGFNNEKYRDEVIERWGQEAWDRSQAWWDSFSEDDKADFAATHERLQDAYDAAQNSGLPIEDPRVQAIVARHREWIQAGWGGQTVTDEAFAGLADMYVADERFAANYTRKHEGGAVYVRDAIHASMKK